MRRTLPAAMPWDGGFFLEPAPYGELGRLTVTEDGSRVMCHVCGRYFRNLGQHAYYAHSLQADLYKERFGLNRTTAVASPAFVEQKRRWATENRTIERMGDLRHWPKGSKPGKAHRLAARLLRSEQRKGVPMPRKEVPCVGCGVAVQAAASRYRSQTRCPSCAVGWRRTRAEQKRERARHRSHARAVTARAARVGACLDCGAEVRPDLSRKRARLPKRCPTCTHRHDLELGRPIRREWMRRARQARAASRSSAPNPAAAD